MRRESLLKNLRHLSSSPSTSKVSLSVLDKTSIFLLPFNLHHTSFLYDNSPFKFSFLCFLIGPSGMLESFDLSPLVFNVLTTSYFYQPYLIISLNMTQSITQKCTKLQFINYVSYFYIIYSILNAVTFGFWNFLLCISPSIHIALGIVLYMLVCILTYLIKYLHRRLLMR